MVWKNLSAATCVITEAEVENAVPYVGAGHEAERIEAGATEVLERVLKSQ